MSGNSRNPLAIQKLLSDLRSDFEADWRSGSRNGIERILGKSADAIVDQNELILRLVQSEIELRRQAGESPEVSDYTSRFPNVSPDSIRDILLLPAPPPKQVRGPLLPDRYRVIREIGRGGIGSVWRVHDRKLDRPLAAKVLNKKYTSNSGANARLDREALLTGGLQHPGIPPVHDRGKLVSGSSFFTMKLVDGDTLAELLKKRSKPSDERVHFLGIFEQITQTIAYAHSQKIIHRDLKPQNIMVGRFGEVQIMDWGMAKRLGDAPDASRIGAQKIETGPDEIVASRIEPISRGETALNSIHSSFVDPMRTLTRQGDVFGTPAYMPPEQARGELELMCEQSDVFGLGAILYEILTGRRLYDDVPTNNLIAAASIGALDKSIALIDSSEVDNEMADLCKRCLAVEPSARPADGGNVAECISDYLTSLEQRLREAEISRKQAEVKVVEEKKRSRLTTALAGTVITTILVGVIATAWYQNDRARRNAINERRRAETLVDAIGAAPYAGLPFAIESIKPFKSNATTLLRDKFDAGENDFQKLRFAIAMAHLGDMQHEFLVERIGDVEPPELSILVDALKLDESESARIVARQFANESKDDSCARYALVALDLGDSQPLETLLSDVDNVNSRAAFIECCASWSGGLDRLFEVFDGAADSIVVYSALVGISEIPLAQISQDEIQELAPRLFHLCGVTPDAKIRAATELILRRWGQDIPAYTATDRPVESRNWYVNSIGMIMVRLDRPGYDENGRLPFRGGYSFFISDRETTIAQFLKFVEEDNQVASRTANKLSDGYFGTTYRDYLKLFHRDTDEQRKLNQELPMTGNFGYYDSVRFCNWLSRREGLEPYYIDRSPSDIKSTYGKYPRSETWEKNPAANGYRLPEYYEYNFACTGNPSGALTGGNTFIAAAKHHHRRFGWYLKNTDSVQPTARKLPNRFGLFDITGNLAEYGDFSLRRRTPTYHIFGDSFVSSKLEPGNISSAIGSIRPSINSNISDGFRVVRCNRENIVRRETKKLESAMQVRVKRWRRSGDPVKFSDMKTFSFYGHRFSDLGAIDLALKAYSESRNVATHLLENDKSEYEPLITRGGDSVNSALLLLDLGKLDEAESLVLSAEKDLTEAKKLIEEDGTADRFLENQRYVLARIWMAQANILSSHWDPAKRDGKLAVSLAKKGIEILGKKDPFMLEIVAASYAEDGQFDQAFEWQNDALHEISLQSDTSEQYRKLRLYENSKPFRQAKPQ